MKWITFKYLGHGYTIMNGTIMGCAWGQGSGQWIPMGKLKFGPEATKAIEIWCENFGCGGLPLEDYLDKVLGPPE